MTRTPSAFTHPAIARPLIATLATLLIATLAGMPCLAADAGAVRVVVETIAVDGGGTRTVGEDEAALFRGSTGVLSKSLTLSARAGGTAAKESVDLTIRITLLDEPEQYCWLRLETEARGTLPGSGATVSAPDRRTASLNLGEDESRIVQVYLSPVTDGRVALKVGCGNAVPAAASDTAPSIGLDLSLERAEDDGTPRLLRSDRLTSSLGKEVSSLFSSNVPLPDGPEEDKRFRRERLNVRLVPQILSGGRVQVGLHVSGEVATVSSYGGIESHRIASSQTLVLSAGESGTLEFASHATDDTEGWSSVRYRIRVTSRF